MAESKAEQKKKNTDKPKDRFTPKEWEPKLSESAKESIYTLIHTQTLKWCRFSSLCITWFSVNVYKSVWVNRNQHMKCATRNSLKYAHNQRLPCLFPLFHCIHIYIYKCIYGGLTYSHAQFYIIWLAHSFTDSLSFDIKFIESAHVYIRNFSHLLHKINHRHIYTILFQCTFTIKYRSQPFCDA